jgi:hypothetical protein
MGPTESGDPPQYLISFAIKNLLDGGRCFGAAASPAGWPPPWHGAAARLRRAAAPQNTHQLAFRNPLHHIGIRLLSLSPFALFSLFWGLGRFGGFHC